MIRTQILLEPELKKELGIQARLYNKSVSRIVREMLKKHLFKSQKRQIGLGGLKKLVDMGVIGGPKNLSETIDEVLY